MDPTTLVRAVVMFAVTNVDDLLLLALFFGQARRCGAAAGIVVGQYLGFGGILAIAIAVAGSFGAALLPAPGDPLPRAGADRARPARRVAGVAGER